VQPVGAQSQFGFAGELRTVDNGLIYLRARWYDPSLARFISVDEFPGDTRTPYSLHAYQYGYSDPVSNTDPTGRCFGPLIVFCVGAVIAGGVNLFTQVVLEDKSLDEVDGAELLITTATGGLMTVPFLGPAIAVSFALASAQEFQRNPTAQNFFSLMLNTIGALCSLNSLSRYIGGSPPPTVVVAGGGTMSWVGVAAQGHKALAVQGAATTAGGLSVVMMDGGGTNGDTDAELFENQFPDHEISSPTQLYKPGDLKTLKKVLNYVVTKDWKLIIGRKQNAPGGGHIDLANGQPVRAAGEFKVLDGKILYVDNTSGHYLPTGANARAAAEKAFADAGLGEINYIEKVWNGSSWVPK